MVHELVQSLAVIAILLFGASKSDYCSNAPYNTYLYCNYKVSIPERVRDFLSRLTVQEKITQLVTSADAIDSLDIPKYEWWSECLHGVAGSPGVHFGGNLTAATSFPQVIGMAATFNMTLVNKMAQVTSTEARVFANNNQAGLTYFAPNINIYRDPRWGRGQETPGEDPYLTSQYAINFVKGIQEGEDDPRYLKAIATCKHYAAYDLENYLNYTRHTFNAIVPDQDLEETYFPAFKACVRDGKVGSIMCSYNAVNGVPSCANDYINNKVARDDWGFEGYVVSDCGAVNDIISKHQYTSTTSDTAQAGLRGGCDLNCGSFYRDHIQEAYDEGIVTDDDIDLAMTRLFTYRMRLGMFDPPDVQPYRAYTTAMVNTKEHQALALDAARESIVLLQNNGILPLDTTEHSKISVIGPNANAQGTMQGNYKGTAPYLISPVQGLQNLGLTVTYSAGCDVGCTSISGFSDATATVHGAKAVIVVIGLDEGQESEGRDRTSLALPGHQVDLLKSIQKKLPVTTPLIVVVMSGGPVDLTEVKELADAILWVGYPGQSGGQAIAEVLYGLVNPSGRLPITFYPASYISIPFMNMSMRVPPGRSYKFYTGTPVFPFGHGLSYTTFSMKWSNNASLVKVFDGQRSSAVTYEVIVTNTGSVAGSVSVLAFISSNAPGAPMKELFGFQKVFLRAGEKTHLSFAADGKVFSTVDRHGKRRILAGNYKITIGDSLTHTVSVM